MAVAAAAPPGMLDIWKNPGMLTSTSKLPDIGFAMQAELSADMGFLGESPAYIDIGSLASLVHQFPLPGQSKAGLPQRIDISLSDRGTIKLPEHQSESNDGGVLTVMVKNIPCGCTEKDVCEAIASLGFEGQYNYFYMPKQRARVNMGYAFVGFENPAITKQFTESMTGYCFPARKSTKVVSVCPARRNASANVLSD